MTSEHSYGQNVLKLSGVNEFTSQKLNQTYYLSPLYQCYDANGWRILLENGSLSPCFVDLVSFLFSTAFLIVLGPFEYNSLWKIVPSHSQKGLLFRAKIVSTNMSGEHVRKELCVFFFLFNFI